MKIKNPQLFTEEIGTGGRARTSDLILIDPQDDQLWMCNTHHIPFTEGPTRACAPAVTPLAAI